MKTYQDLLACGGDGQSRIDFLRAAVADHRGSRVYRAALDARSYYEGENPTISRYEKVIYDLQGKAHKDMYTANHKIKSSFFGFVVDQAVSYLLGNGITFQDGDTKRRLGGDIDQQVSLAGEYALIGGVSFGFWNLDHLEVFQITEFVPLEDEENGALRAGIRFWQVGAGRPARYTLYEEDGLTEYIEKGGAVTVLKEKRPYILHTTRARLESTTVYAGENYPGFPIVPLKNNQGCRSELSGRRDTLDALDLCCSNMVNNVDEGNILYWALTNCGGMDDMDAVRFLERVKLTHVAFLDQADEGSSAEPHAIEAPYEGTQAAIDMLQKKLYQDFQAFDASSVQAGSQTATAIKASYVPLDLKTDRFERQVTKFLMGILKLAGIDDKPAYTRNQILNKQEEAQTVLLAADYVTDEYITRKLLTLLGDADMAESILQERAAEGLGRLGGGT